ncbi:NXPE family member 3-like isoform X2 [Argopecten irradians]
MPALGALRPVKSYLEITDFTDFLSLVNISTSFIRIRKSVVKLGEDVIVDIILYNGRNEPLTRGGDVLRLWLREPSHKASVSGHVIDHGDGSYTGIVKAMWAGNPEVMFSIANTKEHIGIFMNIVHKYGLITFLKAGFGKENVTESTLCSIVPRIPGVSEYCDFTAQNYDMSFFCGKPTNMSCEDWIVYERTIDEHPCNKDQLSLFLHYKYFQKNISTVKVLPDPGTVLDTERPCFGLNSDVTWKPRHPTGYYFNGEYRSLVCKASMPWNRTAYARCLRDRPLLMTGDSTIRNWFTKIADLLDLRILVGRKEIKDKAWHKFSEAENASESLALYWTPHGIPFFSYEQNKNNMRSVAFRIDSMPGDKPVILMLHWFSHLARTTPYKYREHVRSAKLAIIRLLKRSPDSRIFIKGPHAYTYFTFLEPIDYMGLLYIQILHEEFQDLQNKVYFIDQWDATVGNENIHNHPAYPPYNIQMISLFFSFICK